MTDEVLTREQALKLKDAALRTIEVYQHQDPVALQRSNFYQQRFFKALTDPKPNSVTVILALKPNRVGGSWGMVTAWEAIMWGTAHHLFQGSPFGDKWPFLKSARLFSTSEALSDVGPIQQAIKALFPSGKYDQNRGVGKSYNSALTTKDDWTCDMFSFGQDALSAAGANKGLILMSEPPPRDQFIEGLTRLSGNGIMIVECTQLDLAAYLEEMAEDAGGRPEPVQLYRDVGGKRIPCEDPNPGMLRYGTLKLEEKPVGEIRIVRGDVEDACREHSNGHMAHSSIEALIAGWPKEQRDARRSGRPMTRSGRVYLNWTGDNEIRKLDDYHEDCLAHDEVRVASVIDPHDRKPWACTWWACFPNEDVICIGEWPPFVYRKCESSPISKIEKYRDIIFSTEKDISRTADPRLCIIDGRFGRAIKSGRGLNVIQMLAAPCEACEEKYGKEPALKQCRHRRSYRPAPAYDGSVEDGHRLVRAHIGENGERPKVYALAESCPNFCYGMNHYGWKENHSPDRGVSEQVELVHKDFPDGLRMLIQSRGHKWPEAVAPTKIIPRRRR